MCVNKNETILDTIKHLECDLNYICVVDDNGSFAGIVTRGDLANSIDPEVVINSFCLSDFVNLGKRVKWIGKEIKCEFVIEDMAKNRLDSFLVVENKKPIGIFTTKDALRVTRLKLDISKPIKEFMSSPVESIKKSATVRDALEFLNKKEFKRVVLVDDDDSFVGMISQKELFSLAYSRWALMMKQHHKELNDINKILENKNKEILEFASKDLLTGLYNRGEFIKIFNKCLDEFNENGVIFFIAMADIDFFKHINDTYGHNVGDSVLKAVSKEIKNSLRVSDIVARWGGEEFVVLFSAKDNKDAMAVAQKMRVAIEQLDIGGIKTSISIGVSQIDATKSIEDTINLADQALYKAKQNGRNIVEFKV